jgi:hypothetical protein
MEIVSRRCGAFGAWEAFSEEACGVVNEQLNQLMDSFNNVSYIPPSLSESDYA